MSTPHALRLGITVLSAVVLVASGASPVSADAGTDLTGVSNPFGVAFTPSGDTVVANYGGGTDASVAVFTGASTSPDVNRALKGVSSATGIAVSPVNGDVIVTDWWAGKAYTYHAGQQTPDTALTRSVTGAFDVEVDLDGEVYVSSPTANKVLVFPATSTTASRELAVGTPRGIAVHPRTGEIYVGSEADARIHIYPHSSDAFDPARDLAGTTGNPLIARGIAIHPASGRVYAVDQGDDLVMVFEPSSGSPSDSLNMSTGWDTQGIGVNPLTGSIYRSSFDLDKVFVSAGPTMSLAAVAPASGPVTGGTAVTITGANLAAVTGVKFGGVAATDVVPRSPTTVTALAPSHAVGKVDVSVSWGSRTAGLSQAFEFTPVAPGKATAVTGAPGNGLVTVSWTPPADTGGVSLASYTVTPSPAGPACVTAATACTIAGLTNGTKYRFVVRTTNTGNLSTDSDPSAEVTPYIATSLVVTKAKSASYKLKRRGSNTLLSSIKVPRNATREITRSCTNGTRKTSKQLCTFTVYKKSGKVKVRTKGYRNVVVMLSIRSVPKPSAGPTYGPSPMWTRTWSVR